MIAKREKRMNKKTRRYYFMCIVYLMFVVGLGIGLAIGSDIGSRSCLTGTSIALLGFIVSYVLTTRILKGGYKVAFVKKDETTN